MNIWSASLFRLLSAVTPSQIFLFWMTLKILRSTGQIFGRVCPNWDLSGFFHDYTRVMCF